jgi:hypothetical protein
MVLNPIGGNFTMDPDDAAFAAKTWINRKKHHPDSLQLKSQCQRRIGRASGRDEGKLDQGNADE